MFKNEYKLFSVLKYLEWLTCRKHFKTKLSLYQTFGTVIKGMLKGDFLWFETVVL